MSEHELTTYRRNKIGFVFQFYNLVPNLTVLENVQLAMEICEDPLDSKEMLIKVGLEGRLHNSQPDIGWRTAKSFYCESPGQESRDCIM